MESLRSWDSVSIQNLVLLPLLPPCLHHLDTSTDPLTLTPVVLPAGWWPDWVIRLGRSHSPVWCPNQSGTGFCLASRILPSLCSHAGAVITAPTSGGLSGRRNSVWKVRRVGPSASDTVTMFTHQDSENVTTVPLRYDQSQILCFIIIIWDLLSLTAAFGFF